jgi:hypothetical protein
MRQREIGGGVPALFRLRYAGRAAWDAARASGAWPPPAAQLGLLPPQWPPRPPLSAHECLVEWNVLCQAVGPQITPAAASTGCVLLLAGLWSCRR